MIVLTVRSDVNAPGDAIGGGAQSARNLVRGLGVAGRVTTVTWRPGEPGGAGAGADLLVPPPRVWRDARTIEALRAFVSRLEPRSVVHLLEVEGLLGAWLAALRGTGHRVVFTALDHAWLCATSRLLTKRLEPCAGPVDAAGCTRCYFDHRRPGPRLGMRALGMLSRTPLASSDLVPGPVRRPLAAAAAMRAGIETRLGALREDFAALDVLIAPSRSLAEAFASNGFPREKIRNVPYGTPPGTPARLRDRPELSSGVVFGFVGRPSFDKGFDRLVRAVAAIRARGARARLVVMGRIETSRQDPDVRALLRSGAGSWIEVGEFDGRDPAAIDAAHRKFHALVAPSRWMDNLPNAVLEALERRTPVIAPRMGSFVELVDEGDTGWFFENEDGALERALARIADDPVRHLDLPFQARRTRTPEDEARDVLAIYSELT